MRKIFKLKNLLWIAAAIIGIVLYKRSKKKVSEPSSDESITTDGTVYVGQDEQGNDVYEGEVEFR